MESSWTKGFAAGALCACLGALAGCASPQPRDFAGAWRPINQYPATVDRIPLNPTRAFAASPLDATLRGLLTRWAADGRVQLRYLLPYDLTLHQPVANVHSERLVEAVAALDSLYADQRVAVTLVDGNIVVRGRSDGAAADAPAAAAPASARASGSPDSGHE